jgi:hypothetical protein
MFELALLANLNRNPEMTCLQVREIAETVVESEIVIKKCFCQDYLADT